MKTETTHDYQLPDVCIACSRYAEPGEAFIHIDVETNTSYPDGKLTPASICKSCSLKRKPEIPAPVYVGDRVVNLGEMESAARAQGGAPFPMQKPKKKPRVKLIGSDPNAFSVLGLCKRAADKAGWTKEQWREFRDEATGGDYNKLLCAAMDHFDVR